MKRSVITIALFIVCAALLPNTLVVAASGRGTIELGHTFLDIVGNEASNYRTYNTYEGTAISLHDFSYDFDNGIRSTFNGRNLTLNNRNLEGSIGKQRLFGVTVTNSQYRRIYSFAGDKFTRRHNTNVTGFLSPHPNVQLYGGGAWVGYHGNQLPLFSLTDIPIVQKLDYAQNFYHGGIRLNDRGRSLNAEIRGNMFADNLDENNDQTRQAIRVQGILPLPNYEWITVSGGYRYFVSSYDTGDTKFTAKTAWGGGTAALNQHWSFKYAFVFDRAGSDFDLVPTDNLTHAVYLSHTQSKKSNVTVGYQYGINDDDKASVQSSGLYASAWYAFTSKVELKADFGSKAEEVRDGSRLLGDEDWARYRASGRWRFSDHGSLKLRIENIRRENDQIETSVDFIRAGGDVSIMVRNVTFSGSYSYGDGDYENPEELFSFTDHVLSGDLLLPEWQHIQLGGGAVYYRSKRDLNVESFALRFSGEYHLGDHYTMGVNYTADNFDDLTKLNEYYTANIVEITIARDISF